MTQQKILFIDRDGTLIEEPADKQIDQMEKLAFLPGVIPALLNLKKAGFSFVMISNQDGLGTESFPTKDFTGPHELMLKIFKSQGITFDSIRICPHKPLDGCECRKPKIGLLMDYLVEQKMDRDACYVIGDRETDMELAKNLGIKALKIDQKNSVAWERLCSTILLQARMANITRKTKETEILVNVNLDKKDDIDIKTGIGFFDHMLEQLAKHGGFSLHLSVKGDLEIDEHHTVEDTAIALGEAIKKALGDKMGIGRYGFLLPMDESLAHVSLDLSGRSYFVFSGDFKRETVGELSTELVPHFFRSFADGLKATINIEVKGENAHHMIEASFKGLGRALRQAIEKTDESLPSTKGVL